MQFGLSVNAKRNAYLFDHSLYITQNKKSTYLNEGIVDKLRFSGFTVVVVVLFLNSAHLL